MCLDAFAFARRPASTGRWCGAEARTAPRRSRPHDGSGARGPLRRGRSRRGRLHRRRRARPRRSRSRGRRRDGQHRHARVHRLAPAHLGDRDPRDRTGREPRRVLRHRARPARAGLPPRGRVRGQLPGLAGGDRRRRHDAPRLVAHLEHARARRRGDPRAAATRSSAPSTATATRTRRWRRGGSTASSTAPEDIRRIRARYFSSDEGLLTLAMGTRGPGFCKPEVVSTTGSWHATSAPRSASTSGWGRTPAASRWSRS